MSARLFSIALLALMLSGCVTAEPMKVVCKDFRTKFVKDLPDPEIVSAIKKDTIPADGSVYSDETIRQFIDLNFPATILNHTQKSISPDNFNSSSSINLVSIGPPAAAVKPLKITDTDKEMFIDEIDKKPGRQTISVDRKRTKLDQSSPAILLLSGGGQWGAFGAGFLEKLHHEGELPKLFIVTGVSTGALQALFVGAAQAGHSSAAFDDIEKTYAELRRNYSPVKETEIVERGSFISAIFSGSVAKLGPLRKRIELALCKKQEGNDQSCPLIEKLADPNAPLVLLGFVEAKTGKMQFVIANEIAMSGLKPIEKQQCLTGAALASAAMPLYFQQVQIESEKPQSKKSLDSVTYYDGGVRQSVFSIAIGKVALNLIKSVRNVPVKENVDYAGPLYSVYVIRNGPTIVPEDPRPDSKSGALTAAKRGYELIVNQSEVSSIASIRLLFPKAELFLATADNNGAAFKDPQPELEGLSATEEQQACKKGAGKAKEIMFDPAFMTCLRAFGRYKANRKDNNGKASPWIKIPSAKIE